MMQSIQVSGEYYDNILAQLQDDLRAFMDEPVRATKYYLVFDSGVPIGGFAIQTPLLVLTGVFALSKGNGDMVMKHALQSLKEMHSGVKIVSLTCIGEKLLLFYVRHGFAVSSAFPFDERLANKKWNYEKYGKPPVYFMVRVLSNGT